MASRSTLPEGHEAKRGGPGGLAPWLRESNLAELHETATESRSSPRLGAPGPLKALRGCCRTRADQTDHPAAPIAGRRKSCSASRHGPSTDISNVASASARRRYCVSAEPSSARRRMVRIARRSASDSAANASGGWRMARRTCSRTRSPAGVNAGTFTRRSFCPLRRSTRPRAWASAGTWCPFLRTPGWAAPPP
jgi:hypothetical protein